MTDAAPIAGQARLFEVAAAERDAAIARVAAASEAEWRDRAYAAVRVTAERCAEFISDDVWSVGGLDAAREDRALGPVMQSAARAGWIVKTDRVRPSVRSHLAGKPVWRSRLWRGAA